MDTIHALISFVNNGKADGSLFQSVSSEIGDDRMRVIAIKVLGWMKSQHRMGKLRPLRLKPAWSWCNELSELMSRLDIFSDVLELQTSGIVFKSSLSEKTKLEICELVDRKYEPRLMT